MPRGEEISSHSDFVSILRDYLSFAQRRMKFDIFSCHLRI